MHIYDVVIIGAGISGLAAARHLIDGGCDNIVVLEAQSRIGGRIHTVMNWDIPIELGAEFIHGYNPALWGLMSNYGIVPAQTVPVTKRKIVDNHGHQLALPDEELFEHIYQDVGQNGSIGESFLQYITKKYPHSKALVIRMVLNAISDLEAGDASQLDIGMYAANKITDDEWKLPSSYAPLINQLSKDLPVVLGALVSSIDYHGNDVIITQADGQTIHAKKVIITVPLGILKAGKIVFAPALPQTKLTAIHKIGMGDSLKVILKFSDPLVVRDVFRVSDGTEAYIIHSPNSITSWWRAGTDSKVLVGFVGGSRAQRFAQLGNNEITRICIEELSSIAGYDISGYCMASRSVHWGSNPYTLGSYSNDPIGSLRVHRQELARPINEQLYFAGEATNTLGAYGTVHGALESGIKVAELILKINVTVPKIRITQVV